VGRAAGDKKRLPSRRIVGAVVRTTRLTRCPIWAPSEELPDGGVYVPGVIGWHVVPKGATGLAVERSSQRNCVDVLLGDGSIVPILQQNLEVCAPCNSDGSEVS
jgi:hypothetical protein